MQRSLHFMLREWETIGGVRQDGARSDSCLRCSLNNHEGKWEFVSSGDPDKERWWEEERGCHMGLFPPPYFHGLFCRGETGRFASCLISVGGYCYFRDILHSIWLSVLGTTRPLWGCCCWCLYFSQCENKIGHEILLMSWGYLLLRDKKPSTYYTTGNSDTLS